jgi:hypothetical protein
MGLGNTAITFEDKHRFIGMKRLTTAKSPCILRPSIETG